MLRKILNKRLNILSQSRKLKSLFFILISLQNAVKKISITMIDKIFCKEKLILIELIGFFKKIFLMSNKIIIPYFFCDKLFRLRIIEFKFIKKFVIGINILIKIDYSMPNFGLPIFSIFSKITKLLIPNIFLIQKINIRIDWGENIIIIPYCRKWNSSYQN